MIVMTQRRQDGFSLIELLVVIVVLGILAGVVVFAVRGSNDKGHTSAVAADARIVRTALEAHCAQHGRYPEDPPDDPATPGRPDPMDVLKDRKLLSDRSVYHRLTTGNDPEDFPHGNCAGQGPTRYKLDAIGGGGGGGGPSAPGSTTTVPPPDCGGSADTWCRVPEDPPILPVQAQQLPSGKVLLVGRVPGPHPYAWSSAVYDPAGGADRLGAWTPVEGTFPAPPAYDGAPMVVIEGTPAQCGTRCGMVLIHLRYGDEHWEGGWWLYDPKVSPAGRWQRLNLEPQFQFLRAGAALVTGSAGECVETCGKVLVYGGQSDDGVYIHRMRAALYDPETGGFEVLGDPGVSTRPPILLPIGDGRVLIVDPSEGDTKLFNGRTKEFEPGPQAPAAQCELAGPAQPLDRGKWLFGCGRVARGSGAGFLPIEVCVVNYQEPECVPSVVYTAAPDGGVFEKVPGCGEYRCTLLGSTTDGTGPGRVLARPGHSREVLEISCYRGQIASSATCDPRPWLSNFGGTPQWEHTNMITAPDNRALSMGVRLSRGACAPNCGKILLVGDAYNQNRFRDDEATAHAVLYTPPA